MLMGGNHHYSKISDDEIKQASRTMIQKVELAALKTELPLERSSSVNDSYELA